MHFVTFLKRKGDDIIVGLIYSLIASSIIAVVVFLTKPPSADALKELITREADLASAWPHNEKNLQDYGSLFADGAAVIDHQKPQMRWEGTAAIEKRLLPLHFDRFQHQIKGQIQLTTPEKATAVTYTSFQQREPENISGSGYESWQFLVVKESWWKTKRWKISSFTFDLPSNPGP